MKPTTAATTKKALGLALGLVVVGVGGQWLLRRQGVTFADLAATFSLFSPLALVLCAAAHAGVVLYSSFRVWLTLPLPRAVGFFEVFYAVAAGQMANLFLPARAGDVMKAWMIARAAPPGELSPLAAGGAIVADKVLDIFCVVGIAALVSFSLLPRYIPRGTPQLFGALGALAVLFLVSAFITVRHRKHPALDKVRGWLLSFRSGLVGLGRPRVLILGVISGICAWLGESGALRWVCSAAGHPIGFDDAIIALLALYLGVAVPVSFANLGTFEAALALGLQQANVPLPVALAVAAVHHAGQLVGTTVLWLGLLAVRAIAPRPAGTGQTPPGPGK